MTKIDSSDFENETFLTTDNFEDFMNIIKRTPVATSEENYELASRIKNGDEKAREEMIMKNLLLVVSVAVTNKRKTTSYQKLDLIHEGIFGLMRAIDKYDETRGAFSTYAKYWIKQSINRGLEKYDAEIRRPTTFPQIKKKYYELLENFKKQGLPSPDDETITDLLNLTEKTLRLIRQDELLNPISLDAQINDEDDDDTLSILFGYQERKFSAIEDSINDRELFAYLKLNIKPVEYYVLYNNTFKRSSSIKKSSSALLEISKELHITRERPRQILAKTSKKIKELYREGYFTGNLDKYDKQMIERGFFKYTPISPHDITRYLFAKEILNESERNIYKMLYFSNYNQTILTLATELALPQDTIRESLDSLKEKLNQLFSEYKRLYELFHLNIMDTLQAKIFNINLDSDIKKYLKSYDCLQEMWKNKTYEEVQFFAESYGKPIPEELLPKFGRYFKGSQHTPYSRENMDEDEKRQVLDFLSKIDVSNTKILVLKKI